MKKVGWGSVQEGWDKHPKDRLTACKNGREASPNTTEVYCRARSKDSDFLVRELTHVIYIPDGEKAEGDTESLCVGGRGGEWARAAIAFLKFVFIDELK